MLVGRVWANNARRREACSPRKSKVHLISLCPSVGQTIPVSLFNYGFSSGTKGTGRERASASSVYSDEKSVRDKRSSPGPVVSECTRTPRGCRRGRDADAASRKLSRLGCVAARKQRETRPFAPFIGFREIAYARPDSTHFVSACTTGNSSDNHLRQWARNAGLAVESSFKSDLPSPRSDHASRFCSPSPLVFAIFCAAILRCGRENSIKSTERTTPRRTR